MRSRANSDNELRREVLFRTEASALVPSRSPGTPLLPRPWYIDLFFILYWLSLLSSVIAISLLEFSRTELVSGQLVATNGLVRVYSGSQGTVATILVGAGDHIETSQVLGSITPDQTTGGGVIAVHQRLSREEQRRAELTEQLNSAKSGLETKRRKLDLQKLALESQISALQATQYLRQTIVTRLNDQAAVSRGLAAKNILSARDLRDQINKADQARIDLSETTTQILQMKSQLALIPSEIQEEIDSYHLERGRVSLLLLENSSEIDSLNSRLKSEILSPKAGIVDLVTVKVGDNVQANSLLFSIVPENDTLEAELYVPARAIPYIKEGQSVRIEFDAFPIEESGYFDASIRSVNQTILSPDEARLVGITTEVSVYRLNAKIKRQFVSTPNGEIKLRPGMTLTAGIIIGRKPLLYWAMADLFRMWKGL